MAIVWFIDEDRERMRAERAERAEEMRHELLFFEFLRERGDCGNAVPMTPEQFDKVGLLDIRPWPDRPHED